MNISQQKAKELVETYDQILEQQIVERGSSLPCRSKELWMQVEELLRNGNAQELHCLGLDSLRVMEESLKAEAAAVPATSCGRRVRVKGGLQGLATAFEVLEQASLNLFLGPWREEYRVIKMYSGTFTHYIAPVLSRQQIEKLFGLLGYSLCRPEQLHLQSPRVNPVSLDDLLCLSCAFFIARCECQLLVTALGKHVGDAKWELNIVKERQKGSIVQVALDNTKKKFEVKQVPMEPVDAELDLYRDEQADADQKEVIPSHTCLNKSNALPPAVEMCPNTVTCMSPSLELDISKSSSAITSPDRDFCKEIMSDKKDVLGLAKGEPEPNHICGCPSYPHLSSHLCPKQCFECNRMHISLGSLGVCHDNMPYNIKESEEASLPTRNASGTVSSSSALMPPKDGYDKHSPVSPPIHPITFHDCCDLAKLDPQVLCRSCNIFHSGSCRAGSFCQTNHDSCQLGMCSCGKRCSRNPLVLCRYCGREYCNNCWYRNPLECNCGKTFDQSSPV